MIRSHTGSWLFFLFLYTVVSFILYAQQDDYYPKDDSEIAQKYIDWMEKGIKDGSLKDVNKALERSLDFADVSSDISYKFAVLQSDNKQSRRVIIKTLDRAVETNRWKEHNENQALLLKAEHLIILRDYQNALECLEKAAPASDQAGSLQIRTDAAMLRLLALRGMASNDFDSAQALSRFLGQTLIAMDRFPRDSRPLRIFFEYAQAGLRAFDSARNIESDSLSGELRNKESPPAEVRYARNRIPADHESGDVYLLELALRRLPFLLDADPDLAWMAAPFIYDLDYARRLVGAYRAALSQPDKKSIPIALNLGLIDDDTAIEELFTVSEGYSLFLEKDVIIDAYKLLRSEKGRELFTQRIHSFHGRINDDIDKDGYYDNYAIYNSGVLRHFYFDRDQDNIADFNITAENDFFIAAEILRQDSCFIIEWERYPSVKTITFKNDLPVMEEKYLFAPAGFQYAPVRYIEIGGSQNISGLSYLVPVFQNIDLTHQSLISFCSSIIRKSPEIEDAEETIYMNSGVILQVIEKIGGKQVSVTEFERGLPVIQRIDLDLDGSMETIRRFRKPPQDYTWQNPLDYRRLIASSESDWSGDGKHKTREVYQPDGSVVYYFDMDGSGIWTHSETGNER